jgi:endonuclease/exonuclease/phosphatase family metal-dependent hydrolase
VATQDGAAEDASPAGNDAAAARELVAADDLPSQAGTFTVASMNLHCGVSRAGEPFDLGEVVCGLGTSVIGLQETWTAESAPGDGALAAAAGVLGARLLQTPLCTFRNLAFAGAPLSGPGEFGLAVLSTLPVAGHELVTLGIAPGDTILRVAQIVWVRLGNASLLRFVNTHLTNRPFSPVQLWRLRRLLGGHDGPTVVTGDLNMPRPAARLIAGYTPAVEGRTWPAERPLLQLDHILASRHLDRLGGAVLGPAGSDHLAVRARLRVRAAARPH